MALTFGFYRDAALTTPVVGNLAFAQKSDGSTGAVDMEIFLGSTAVGRKIEADSDPGVDPIVLSVVDAAAGTGHPATEVKLATTQGGLTTATGGASLDLPTTILSGAVNAQPVWLRVLDSTMVVGISTELSITTNTLREGDSA